MKREAIASLQANRVDPKSLYVTARQAELWRQVSAKHSPIHHNPEFTRIYREAFARAAELMPPDEVYIAGLGCGTGAKEAELCLYLKSRGTRVRFSDIDISRDLVEEASRRLAEAGAVVTAGRVCDLAEVDPMAQWRLETGNEGPILFTFFGIVPNFAPSLVTRLFRAILRPGDVLLVSVHLAPVGKGVELPAAMQSVLPQYDNPETLAWLRAALEQWDLQDLVDAPEMKIGEIEGMPAFVGTARWNSSEPFERWGHRFTPPQDEPLQLFHSLRYTPTLFEDLLRGAGFQAERLAMTACREEAVWAVKLLL
jgi:SAM-dependent methyltransferase